MTRRRSTEAELKSQRMWAERILAKGSYAPPADEWLERDTAFPSRRK